MEVIIQDEDLEELILYKDNKKYKKYARDKKFMAKLVQVYDIFRAIPTAAMLSTFSYLHYEKLKHRDNQYSVRIGNQWVERLIFEEYENGIRIIIIELNTDHYGNKD